MPNVRLPHNVSTSHHRFDVLSGMLGHQKQHNMIAKSQHMQQVAEDRAAALADTEVRAWVCQQYFAPIYVPKRSRGGRWPFRKR